jgi:DNA-binding GntR family transcriptional regulator
MDIHLNLNLESHIPLYLQIRDQIREKILRGELPPGTRLPSERRLARHLGLSRTPVLNAYGELVAEGLLETHVGRGTIVVGCGLSGE